MIRNFVIGLATSLPIAMVALATPAAAYDYGSGYNSGYNSGYQAPVQHCYYVTKRVLVHTYYGDKYVNQRVKVCD